MDIKAKIKELEAGMIACRRDLHKYAECGWTEYRTAAKAIKKMRELGYTITMGEAAVKKNAMMGVPSQQELSYHEERAVKQGADKELVEAMKGGLTGFWADMKFSDDNSPMLAFRFDMDSNDVHESTDEDHRPFKEGFSSVNQGVMHACGHDAHVAIGLALAEVIVSMKQKLKGSIRFIFQPAEEGLRGAAPMVEAGAVDGVDYIVGLHVSFQAPHKGDLVCGAEGFFASTKWDVHFKGVASHAGAAPQEGKNALLAAATAALNLHAISRHSGGPTRINVGKLVAGEGRNIVPPNAFMSMETRGLTTELNNYMVKEAKRVIKASAEMYDCEYSTTMMGGTRNGKSDREMIEIIADVAKDVPYYTNIIKIKNFGAGEDFAHMMSEVQANGGHGSYIQVGLERRAGHHNDKFDIDEDGLIHALELLAKLSYRILGR